MLWRTENTREGESIWFGQSARYDNVRYCVKACFREVLSFSKKNALIKRSVEQSQNIETKNIIK